MTDYSGELVTFVEIVQPFCSLSYGDSPCSAALGSTGQKKCYNTRSSCQDAGNYTPAELVLRFSKQQEGLSDYGYVIPSVKSVSITPMTINLGGMDSDISPFGRRESVSIQFADHQHSDLHVDKYREERPTGAAGTVIQPYEVGSFWGKWLARNPYHEGYQVRIRQGIVGQPLEEMEVRHYIVDRITGPADGKVTLIAKDVFAKVESRKAVAPKASRGELLNGFDEAHSGTITVIPEGIADIDYPVGEFHVAINDEAIMVSRSAGSSTLEILARGELGTQPEEHEGADKVQLVLSYRSQRAHDIVKDLLTGYAGIDTAMIPGAQWTQEMQSRPELLTADIAQPVPVETLVGELAEQMGFSVWPSVRENQIKLKALTADDPVGATVDDDGWIKQGTYSSKRMMTQRVSQVWVYYGQRNPIASQDDTANYHSRRVFADLEAEDLYGSPSIKQIFSRWIPQFGGTFAATAGSRILSLFRDPPLRSAFSLHRSRDGQLTHADRFRLESRDHQNDSGLAEPITMAPIELVRDQESIHVLAQEVRFFSPPATERVIPIESDTLNFNMRASFEQLFGAPAPGDTVIVRVLSGVVVGSGNPTVPSLATGDWPVGVSLRLEIFGTVLGLGGAGGSSQGSDGQDGGIAIKAGYNLVIDNLGVIGGGGGGGGGATATGNIGIASAEGGGGAGRNPGAGFVDGTDTTGGIGQESQLIDDNVEPEVVFASAGRGGDIGKPGADGSASSPTAIIQTGKGGRAGPAVTGAAIVVFENDGTIYGELKTAEDTVLSPPAVSPENLSLTAELSLISSGDYTITLVLQFEENDERVVSYEVQYKLARHTDWKQVYNSRATRWEWRTAEVGQHQVRVRAVYVPGLIFSEWAETQIVSLGTFDAIASIGLSAPINPLLFITTNPEKQTADIRIRAGYQEGEGAVPDRFVLFYSAAEAPNALQITQDAGSKLYLDESVGVAGTFLLPVTAGSTASRIRYHNNVGADIDLSGMWWIAIESAANGWTRYYKVNESSSTELVLGAGDELPFVPAAGDVIHVAELDFADSRLPEFKLAWINGEVVRHRGINFDGQYYIDVVQRGTEGTAQANQSGQMLHYFPALGPGTNAVEIMSSEFAEVDGVYEYSGTIPVNIPTNMAWAAVSCCLARKATSGENTQYVRSHIVDLTVAGPA